ncbi:MAG: diacylglycerol kinase family lipid kinase [Nitrospiraceae bacterium]|nr:MAG: diacylglycerol kinase family lipid kinase [Nitrospiraceae bacterium]
MNASLIANPAAGNKAHRFISGIETLLKQKASLTTFITRQKRDAFEFALNISDTDLIVVAGGDGTFNEVLNGVLSSSDIRLKETPLALIPLGTTNVLARELRIPQKADKAIELALTGKPGKVSLGRINGWYFASMAGIGFDAETVLGVKNNLIKKVSGKAAHIVSGFRVLAQYNPPAIKIKTPENEYAGYTAVVGNASNYGGYFHVTPAASVTEPILDVCIFNSRKRKDLLRFIGGVIAGRHLYLKDVSYFKTRGLEITSGGTVHIQVDGDYFGILPAKIDVVRDAISIVR